MATISKDLLHRLVDELPEEEFPAARRFLEYLRDRAAEEPCPECGALEHVPNEETRAALRESQDPSNWIRAKDSEDLFRQRGI